MEEHEPLHVVDHLVREAQCPHAVAGHAGADHLVMVEADALGPDRAGLGLADVVEQGRQAEDQSGRRLGHHG
ncbi:MAG TPA: hypothetical protein VJM49_18475, partial [Acidimicrobiales bacterium]|nr:hypothetical protein [Acidimicrobiales bacterium]